MPLSNAITRKPIAIKTNNDPQIFNNILYLQSVLFPLMYANTQKIPHKIVNTKNIFTFIICTPSIKNVDATKGHVHCKT